jgi:hypothetical protein
MQHKPPTASISLLWASSVDLPAESGRRVKARKDSAGKDRPGRKKPNNSFQQKTPDFVW